MKLIISSLFFISVQFLYASTVTSDTVPRRNGKFFYSGVIETDSVGRSQLHARALLMLIEYYKHDRNLKFVMNDKQEGIIILRTFQNYNFQGFNYVAWHKLSIFIKDDKIRYEITDFEFRSGTDTTSYTYSPVENYDPVLNWKRKELLKEMNLEATRFAANLQKGMAIPPGGKDW